MYNFSGLIDTRNVQTRENSRCHDVLDFGIFNVGFSVTVHGHFTSMSLILPMLYIFLSGCKRSTAEKKSWLFHWWIIIGILGRVDFLVNFRPCPPFIYSPTYKQFIPS